MTKPNEILSREIFSIGSTGISLQSITSAAIIIAASFLAVWLIRYLIGRAQKRLGENRASTLYVGGQVARYVIVVAAIAAAISALGVDLSALSLFAGALGVGIGLGLQDVVKNFVCGLILLFDGSIEIGDFVEIDEGAAGAVAAIGPRATTLRTNDNVDVLVPNANLLNGRLKNWTRDRASRRIHIPFPVAYGSDKELVRLAALEAAAAVPFTLPDTPNRKAQVWMTGFGDSALNFELVVWPSLEAVKRPGSMMAAYHWALDDALRSHGIEIPFPQSEVRLRSYYGVEGRAAMEVIAGKEKQPLPENPKVPKMVSVNDAAQDVATGGDGD
ncbi:MULTISPECIES: mechanosensitive ion channel domain-containing protein [unclassified Novosphingobium]|uniref:mechanosensitive ion channel family protein n=1 Tax=unclassified Novosphingobium TaxID=2644732 RepID=UPI0025F06BED|nr:MULTISPECIES: mechanosensitive ion channel domain-containing protein [unclassified Novosphingobium]HQV02851.1 mechanosensitive ion channel [Novosphingobium sp.]